MRVTLRRKITEINNAKSTLNKDFSFKTHSGSVISVKGEGYGWALDVEKKLNKFNKPLRKAKNRFLLLIFTGMVGRRKVSVIKQHRIMASETRMQKFQLQSNKFGFTKMEN